MSLRVPFATTHSPVDNDNDLLLEAYTLSNRYGIVLRIKNEILPCAFDCANFQISGSSTEYSLQPLHSLKNACLLNVTSPRPMDVVYRCVNSKENDSPSILESNRVQVSVSGSGSCFPAFG